MTVETLFDLIQIPIIGAITGYIVFRQLRKTQPDKASTAGLFAGVAAAALYGALKFVF